LLEGRHLSGWRSNCERAGLRHSEQRHNEQRFRDLFNNSPDPCWIIENGAFTDCNLAAVQALGYARREDILQHPSRLSPEFQPDGRSSFDKAEEMMQRAARWPGAL
jgi:PAS domain S-box-containing protein